MRSALVVSEIALALVLLVGAGLLARRFWTLMRVDAGFDTSRTVTMKVTLPSASFQSDDQIVRFFDRLFQRIDALPGVQAAGGISFLPLNGLGAATGFSIEGHEKPRAGEEPVSEVKVVTHDFFKAMGIPLLRGRLFDGRDTAPNTRRVIISELLVKKYFGNRDPIGQRIVLAWNNEGPDEIVGVVGDVRSVSLETEPRGASYLPPARFAYPYMSVAIKTSDGGKSIVPAIVNAVHELDSNVPVSQIRPMSEVIAVSTSERRLTMGLLVAFSAIALVLAAVGIYGVISYSVTQRTQEIGIRMALGAQRADVLWLMLNNGMRLSLVGAVLGLGGAYVVGHILTNAIPTLPSRDPMAVAGATLALISAALLASYIPARRATKVAPMEALRYE